MNAKFALGALSACLAWCQQTSDKRGSGAPPHFEARGTRSLAEELPGISTDERIRTYQTKLKSAPENMQLHAGLIAAYLQKLRESADYHYLDLASNMVDQILEKDGGNFTALRFQNEIDLHRHDFKAVAERAEDMARYAPSDPGNWGNLGDALMELGEYERAGQAYSRMFALRPNLASYNRLAFFRFVTGDAQDAIRLMQEAVEAEDPIPQNVAWCLAELGDMYFKTGKLAEAEDAYRKALNTFPTLHRAHAGLGRTCAARGDVKSAIEYYERAQAIVPLVEYAGALEDLYAAANKPDKARQQRDLVSTIEKIGKVTNERTNRNLALVLADHRRDLDFALNLMKTEIPTRGDVYTWDALSWVLFQDGHLEEAQTAMQEALKLGTPEPLFYFHASKIARASGDERTAREYAQRMASLNPKFDYAKAEMPLQGDANAR